MSTSTSSTQIKGDTFEYEAKKKFEEINVMVHGVKWVLRWVVGYVIKVLASGHILHWYFTDAFRGSRYLSAFKKQRLCTLLSCFHEILRETTFIWWFHGKIWYGYTCYFRKCQRSNRAESDGACILRSYCVLWWQCGRTGPKVLSCYAVL